MHLIMDWLLMLFFKILLVVIFFISYIPSGYSQLSPTDEEIEHYKKIFPNASREELIEIAEDMNRHVQEFNERPTGEGTLAKHLITKDLFGKLKDDPDRWQSIKKSEYSAGQIEEEIKNKIFESGMVDLDEDPYRYCFEEGCYNTIDFVINNILFSNDILSDIEYRVLEVVGDDGENYVGTTEWLGGSFVEGDYYSTYINFINKVDINTLKFARLDLLFKLPL